MMYTNWWRTATDSRRCGDSAYTGTARTFGCGCACACNHGCTAWCCSTGDIGKHFPDTDPQYKGISSMKLLEHVRLLLEKNGYVVENIDATVIAQKPKLRPYIAQMEKNIAKTLGIAKEQINIKATTEEGLGFTGTEEGISSQAICMLNGFYESSMVVGGGSKCAGCSGCSRS